MLDACAPHARWIDVFCEDGAFDGEQTRAILEAGIAKGLTPRVHANQLRHGPGIQIAVELERRLRRPLHPRSPTTTSTRSPTPTPSPRCSPAPSSAPARPYPDARRLIDAGVTVALAADCNPGSSYTTNIPFCIAIAVREMHMTPDEAVWAATARRRASAPTQPTSATSLPAPAPTRSCSTPRATSTSPTVPASRSVERGVAGQADAVGACHPHPEPPDPGVAR